MMLVIRYMVVEKRRLNVVVMNTFSFITTHLKNSTKNHEKFMHDIWKNEEVAMS